jgi:hypothetical protein
MTREPVYAGNRTTWQVLARVSDREAQLVAGSARRMERGNDTKVDSVRVCARKTPRRVSFMLVPLPEGVQFNFAMVAINNFSALLLADPRVANVRDSTVPRK